MSRAPLIVRIPGRRNEKLAITNNYPLPTGMQKRTPEWMVSFDSVNQALLGGTAVKDLLPDVTALSLLVTQIRAFSSVKKLGTFTELFGWNAEAFRFVSGAMAGSLMTSGSVMHSPLTLMIPSGTFAADAEEAMSRGILIRSVIIIRLGHIQGKLSIMQTVVFKDCRFIRFQQQLDRLILHCTILEKQTMLTVFNQDGSIAGFAVGGFNIKTGKSGEFDPPTTPYDLYTAARSLF